MTPMLIRQTQCLLIFVTIILFASLLDLEDVIGHGSPLPLAKSASDAPVDTN